MSASRRVLAKGLDSHRFPKALSTVDVLRRALPNFAQGLALGSLFTGMLASVASGRWAMRPGLSLTGGLVLEAVTFAVFLARANNGFVSVTADSVTFGRFPFGRHRVLVEDIAGVGMSHFGCGFIRHRGSGAYTRLPIGGYNFVWFGSLADHLRVPTFAVDVMEEGTVGARRELTVDVGPELGAFPREVEYFVETRGLRWSRLVPDPTVVVADRGGGVFSFAIGDRPRKQRFVILDLSEVLVERRQPPSL
jgi:hypothetical protein